MEVRRDEIHRRRIGRPNGYGTRPAVSMSRTRRTWYNSARKMSIPPNFKDDRGGVSLLRKGDMRRGSLTVPGSRLSSPVVTVPLERACVMIPACPPRIVRRDDGLSHHDRPQRGARGRAPDLSFLRIRAKKIPGIAVIRGVCKCSKASSRALASSSSRTIRSLSRHRITSPGASGDCRREPRSANVSSISTFSDLPATTRSLAVSPSATTAKTTPSPPVHSVRLA